MEWNIHTIIFVILFVDSLAANMLVHAESKKLSKLWRTNFRTLSRAFPLSRGWSALYLVLTLYIGYLVLA
ncbi:MAG: hypothetical protein O3B64_01125 [bacterium]|nr:hypothetical protein [bacterium]MDA1024707.1 hypothetical protein [bacterium]